MNKTRLTQKVRSKVRPPCVVFLQLATLLSVVFGVTGVSSPFNSTVHVRAEYRGPMGSAEQLSATVIDRRLPRVSHAIARSAPSEEYVSREKRGESIGKRDAEIGALPKSYRTLSFNEITQWKVLRHAPMEFSKAAKETHVVMTLPMPNGTFARFQVEESPVLAPLLAARFPAIKTYRGRGVDDPTALTRFDVGPAGFHAIVLSSVGTVIIEPAGRGQATKYVSYDQRDATKSAGAFNCHVSDAEQLLATTQSKQLARRGDANLTTSTGPTLRTYRLALAATAEFTQTYGGGTVSGALAAITTTINAVNAIFERDLAIRMVLVDNETSIIFTDTATDGYTSDNATILFNQNQGRPIFHKNRPG